jgi:hypothetical protein
MLAHRCGLPSALERPEWPRVLPSTTAIERDLAPEGTVTLAVLPDTQYYSTCRYPHLRNQSEWLARERERRHLVAALTLGDLTDHNTDDEWSFFKESIQPLGPDFPLLLTTGNHDTGTQGAADHRESALSRYFDEAFASRGNHLRAVKTPGAIENAFYSIDLGKVRLGVLMLEWSPRQSTVEWANDVLARFPDHRVVVATHAYLYDDGTRYDFARRQREQRWSPFEYGTALGNEAADPSYDGEMLWNALVRRHPGVFLVVSGHVLGQGAGHLTSRGDAGNAVHQILVNYQMLDEGGLGYLRMIEIHPDGQTLHLKTYSPSLGLFSYASEQDYRLQVEPPLF